ncbi:MAG: DUF427 domain-containing protein [Actinobacteria bacterium]|nr:DUF427 domain-containing protein [Actinomycetota bacterium]
MAESVWDYPRPPAVRACSLPIEVHVGGVVICRTSTSWQVLETSHPPTYYLPREAFAAGVLQPGSGHSFCEWKGAALYLDLVVDDRTEPRAAWYYPNPSPGFEMLTGHVALYAGRTDGCFVDGERVTPQPGGFYGGWITADVTGPFKGGPDTRGW